jgi:hypothetical protein
VDGLDQELDLYTITDQTMMDGLSALSLNRDIKLHLGIEEVLRQRINGPMDRSHLMSLRLEHATVREVLNALCNSDKRYTWSVDGLSINVFPAARAGDPTDLLNSHVGRIDLSDVPDPDQALTPLAKMFPAGQVT